MRTQTIEQTIYSYSDLLLPENESLKEKVIGNFRDSEDYSYIWNEAYYTVKKFNEVFDLKGGVSSWLDFNSDCNNDAFQYELTGIRLRTFIINNYYSNIYSAKIFRLKNNWNKRRTSKLFKTNCCELTGVYYDDMILAPIYNLIESYTDKMSEVSFKDLITDCYENLRIAINEIIEYNESDEGLLERIESTGYEFDEDGDII
jgi:hypothetical protein